MIRTRGVFALLLVLPLVGCGGGGFFVSRPSETAERPRVTVNNEWKGAIYFTFAREKAAEERLDVPAFGEGTIELAPGTYDYQLFMQGRTEFKADWYSHGPQGVVEVEGHTRYFHRHRPR